MLNELITRYPCLKECQDEIVAATQLIIERYKAGKKLMICGNGGSCADAEHIVGELMKGFLKMREINDTQKQQMRERCPQIPEEYLNKLQCALPAIALPSFTALNTAFCNDVDPELIFAQTLMGLGNTDDILLCISTSGNSKNAMAAALVAKSLGLTVIALTGEGGGKLGTVADITVAVPERETFKVQELHLPVYHYICAAIEDYFF